MHLGDIAINSYCNYSEGSIPQGVFCERSSQKTREFRREIMLCMISVHREACNCEGTEQLPLIKFLALITPDNQE